MITDSLLIKYLDGDLSPRQVDEILQWIELDPENQAHFKLLKSTYENQNSDVSHDKMDEDWLKLQSAIEKSDNKTQAVKTFKISGLMRVAAAVIILAIGTTFILQLKNDNAIIIGNSKEPVSAFLPDGSEVHLSKGSKLSYHKNFNQELREVTITGEVFFSVTSNPNCPFIVNTGDAKIKVTGTSFHVTCMNNNKNDDVEVLVESGKVLFYNSETFSENSFKVDLGPGDKGIYSSRLNQLNKSRNNQYSNQTLN